MKTRQDVKTWLNRYRYNVRKANHLVRDMKEIESLIDGLKSQELTGMPSGSGKQSSVEERSVILLSQKHEELQKEVIKTVAVRREIEDAINSVDTIVLRELLHDRYIDGMRWEEIACELHYTWQYVHELHRKALDIVSSNLNI